MNTTTLAPAIIEPRPARCYRLVETRARRGHGKTWLAILELPNGNGATLCRGDYQAAMSTLYTVLMAGDTCTIRPLVGVVSVITVNGPGLAQLAQAVP